MGLWAGSSKLSEYPSLFSIAAHEWICFHLQQEDPSALEDRFLHIWLKPAMLQHQEGGASFSWSFDGLGTDQGCIEWRKGTQGPVWISGGRR